MFGSIDEDLYTSLIITLPIQLLSQCQDPVRKAPLYLLHHERAIPRSSNQMLTADQLTHPH
jgi:hypothetical protein